MLLSVSQRRALRLAPVVSALVLTLALAACGSSASVGGAPVGGASTEVAGDVKPTHPPTLGTPTPTMTPYSATPASIAGWQTYTDSTYHFEAVIPPGWRIGVTSVADSLHGGECSYDVMYLPPGDTRAVEPDAWVGDPQYMLIEIGLQCLSWMDPPPPNWAADGTVTISGISTTLYSNDESAVVARTASVEFGGHPYYFTLVGQATPQTAAVGDLPLYLGVLKGFRYQGT